MALLPQKSLDKKSDKVTAAHYGKYFKHVITFRGLKGPTVNAVFRDYAKEITALELNDAIKLAESCFKSTYAEDKVRFSAC